MYNTRIMTNFKEIFPGLDFLHDAHPETATEISSLVPMIAEHAWGELREGGASTNPACTA